MEYLAELYKTDSKGKTRHWRIWVEGNTIKTEHGVYGGTLIPAEKTIHEGKNIGKVNETTPEEQALSEALSTIQKKRDKNYGDTPGHTKVAVLPMLAHDFRKREKAISYPCYIQPKLDGIRCFAFRDPDGNIALTSRAGKEFIQPFEKIRSQINDIIKDGEIWDGELYTDKLRFEEITGACRKEEYRKSSELVEFHLFDIFTDSIESFQSRFELRLLPIFKKLGDRIKLVETILVNSRDEAMELYSRYMAMGHEGIMFRNAAGPYKAGYRSKDLQKYKEFIDEEFEIVGAKQGTGKDEGTVIWVCKNRSGRTSGEGQSFDHFDVRPRGSHEQRKIWWEERDSLIGQKLTVRYQNLTEYGIPRFPVGIEIRNYE